MRSVTIKIEDFSFEIIKESIVIGIDTRFPGKLSYTSDYTVYEPVDVSGCLVFSEERSFELINEIYRKLKDFNNPIVKNNGTWIKYIYFVRLSSDRFILCERNFKPLYEISDLGITF